MGQSKRKYSSDKTTHSKRATTSTMRQLSLLLLLSAAMLCSASTLRVKRGVKWRRTCREHSQCGLFQACSQRKCRYLCFSDDCNKGVNNARDLWGWTPLHRAAYYHDDAVITESKSFPSECIYGCDQWGKNDYVAKRLIENSANVDSTDNAGWTALHYAAYRNGVAVAKVLIENSANVSSANNDGWTALHWAAYKNSVHVAKILIAHSANVKSTAN